MLNVRPVRDMDVEIIWGTSPMPAGSELVGVVIHTNAPWQASALAAGDGLLIRTGAGIYVQGNCRVLKSLPQQQVRAALARAEMRG